MTEKKTLNSLIIHPTREPGVIDNAMLTRCILEYGPTEEAGRLFAEEGVHLDEAPVVRLEFQNILRIDHLWMLTSLTKLTLAHNLIERIENLELLKGLNELDLSFNKIEKIENLDELHNLEVLTLFHNKIRKLENMDCLEKLLVFSIGDNMIEDYKEMSSSEPKTKRKKTASYTAEDLKNALHEIREHKKPIRQVCREFNIPKSTILDRISGRTTDEIKKPGPDPVLGKDGEKRVVEWLINISKCGFPVKKQELLDTIQKIIRDGEIKSNFKDDRPGEKWYQKFLERNKEISLKNAEGINKARALVTEESIRLWFKGLEEFLTSIGQKDVLDHPERIFNGDESGFALCPKTGKVLGPKGYRNVYQIKQGNEKENITVLLTFNANGDVCPPCVVFPYIRPPKAVVESMPPEWCLGKSESGWMKGDVFFEFITNDFNNWVEQNNIKKPILLLVDGHKSHMSLMLSTMCEEMQIILYALPPNTTHILQPADVSVFAPLKSKWKDTVRKFLSAPENLNSAVTKTNFCSLLSDTLKQSNMVDIIKNGFRRCGLYPFDSNSPDYTKCVRNTLENLKSTTEHNSQSKDINHSDIVSTKKVLKHLKPVLKAKRINTRFIMKELNILKKSLPANENNVYNISTESELCSENNETSMELSKEQHTDINETRPTACDLDENNEISISVHDSQEEEQIADGPEPYVITVSAQIHTVPNDAFLPNVSIPKTIDNNEHLKIKIPSASAVDYDEITVYPEVPEENSEIRDYPQTTEDHSIINIEENINSISTLHLSELELGSIVSLDDIIVMPGSDHSAELSEPQSNESYHPFSTLTETGQTTSDTSTKGNSTGLIVNSSTPIALRVSQYEKMIEDNAIGEIVSSEETLDATISEINDTTAEPQTEENPPRLTIASTSTVSRDTPENPFDKHLMLPELLNKTRKTKQRTPAAISSSAWRKYYENKEQIKNNKLELSRKRKLERIEKQNKEKTLKDQNTNRPTQKRKKKRNTGYFETTNENVPIAKGIQCAECDDILISDVEDDDDKNLGCDECIRWYHLKCTKFAGQAYILVKDEPFKCNCCV